MKTAVTYCMAIILVAGALSLAAPEASADSFSFKVGAGYNRYLASKFNSIGGAVGAGYALMPNLSLDLTGLIWMYKVEDTITAEQFSLSNIRVLLGGNYDFGSFYGLLGGGMNLVSGSASNYNYSTNNVILHFGAGHVFPAAFSNLDVFAEARSTCTFAFKGFDVAAVGGVRF